MGGVLPGLLQARRRARVLDRGGGSGLGLAIASAAAKLHGGELVLQDNAPGLRAVLRLSLRLKPA